MASRRWRVVLLMGMGLAAAACGAEMGRRAETRAPAVESVDITVDDSATKPAVVVDVEHPWMKWGEPRPDSGRGWTRKDPTRSWGDAKVLEIKPPVDATTAPAMREAIPKPVEPGSRVGSTPIVPEPAGVLGR